MGPPANQWYPSPGSSFTSMYPGSSPPWSTLQLEASKQLQTSIPPVPNLRVGLHLQASFLTSLAPGFQPHTSNHEPSEFLNPLSGLQAPVSHVGIRDPGLPGQSSSSRSPAPGFLTAPDLQTSSLQSQSVIFISSR